ncbi:MAG: hypothetical protein AAF479_07345 [Pseudomonadota bacterium]
MDQRVTERRDTTLNDTDGASAAVLLPAISADARDVSAQDSRGFSIFWMGCLSLLVAIFGTFFAIEADSRPSDTAPPEKAIGAILASGGLYHVDSEQVDHRALVQARLEHLSETPGIVVIADRSWQLVQQDLRWKRRVFGAYVDNLAPRDVEVILRQLLASGKVPETIMIGLTPAFLAGPLNGSNLLSQMVYSGSNGHASDRAQRSLSRLITVQHRPAEPRPGVLPYDEKLDTLFPDGSTVWAMERVASPDAVIRAKAAKNEALALSKMLQKSSFTTVVDLGEVIAEARSAGIEVVLTLTPLHPEIYRKIHNTQTSARLHEAVEDLLSMARGLEVTTLGSFEPFAAGCRTSGFASIDVPAQNCLSRFLDAAFAISDRKTGSGLGK